jgi:hypothetical protein
MQSIIALSRHSSQRIASLAGYLSRQANELSPLVGDCPVIARSLA